MPFLFGLAPDGVYLARLVAFAAVRSYRTLSAFPHAFSRSEIAIGSFLSVALSLSLPIMGYLAGRYPASYLNGARTFLDIAAATVQPSDGRL